MDSEFRPSKRLMHKYAEKTVNKSFYGVISVYQPDEHKLEVIMKEIIVHIIAMAKKYCLDDDFKNFKTLDSMKMYVLSLQIKRIKENSERDYILGA